MHGIKNKIFFGYFGTAQDDLKHHGAYQTIHFEQLLKKLCANIHQDIKTLFFLEQTHSADVFIINAEQNLNRPLDLQRFVGDAIITNQKSIAIGVATADCLPLFLYDPINNAIGVIHAGWKGLRAKIITTTIQKMTLTFGTNPSDLEVYLGPSAQVCCYEVQKDFLEFLPTNAQAQKIITIRDNKIFFNARVMSILELISAGVLEPLIDTKQNCCTICSQGFCSFRKDNQKAGRQPSVALLI